MRTLEEHRKKLKEAADLALSNGLEKSGIDLSGINHFSEITKEQREDFITACHDGFKKAQKIIIQEIQDYQAELTLLKEKLKESRRLKDKTLEKEILVHQEIISTRIASFSHIIDSIAWQLLGQQIATARRFHINEKGTKTLVDSNISHAIKVADEINQDPLSFALISDITNFIQIGDLLVLHEGQVGVMELKEGAVNDQIAEFLNTLESKKQSIEDIKLEELFNKDTIKQIKRVVRQKERTNQLIDLINNDEGVDPSSGTNMKIGTPSVPTEYYYEELIHLQESLEEKIWAYDVVDACLHIGMYRDEGIQMAPFTLKAILENETSNYILVDWMSISQNLSEPLFSKPFPPDFIINVLTGKVKVMIGLNLDVMMELFSSMGLETAWMSTKETAKVKQKKITEGLVEKNNRGISMQAPSGVKIIMYGGTIGKMIFDNIKPSSIAASILSLNYESSSKTKGKKTSDNNS